MTRIAQIRAVGTAIAAVALAVVPSAASGATATTLGEPGTITFEAAPGELNVLSISREGVTDPEAPDSAATVFELSDNPADVLITPLGECRAPNGTMTPNYRVFCPVSLMVDLNRFVINVGDGNDIVQGHTQASWRVDGGPGGDGIESGDAGDRLTGGTGNDTLDGQVGNDLLIGGDGKDVISDTEGRNDVRAGPGNDSIVDGENVSHIDAGPGKDLLTDQGGPGDDITMGPGNDRAVTRDGFRDTVRCGDGDHDKAIVDSNEKALGCEDLRRR